QLYEQNAYADVCVLSVDSLAKYAPHINERVRFKTVVFDEVHYLKGYKAQRTVAAKEVAKLIMHKFKAEALVLALTGTPVINDAKDMLSMIQLSGRIEDVGGWVKFQKHYLAKDY